MTPRTPTKSTSSAGGSRYGRGYTGAGWGSPGAGRRGTVSRSPSTAEPEGQIPAASEELLRLLAKALVGRPEEVKVTGVRREGLSVLLLEVAKDDVGRVIGKQGRIIKAIRKVIRTTGGPAGKSLIVEVVSN